MHQALRSLIIVFILFITACSNDSSNSSVSTVEIEGWVGAQGISNAQVVTNQVSQSGQVNVNTNGVYVGVRESSDNKSRFVVDINLAKTNLLIARGQIADADNDNDNLATEVLCQVKTGCLFQSINHEYGDLYTVTSGFEWRTIIFNATEDSRNNINAITTMADAFAYRYDVKEGTVNDVYTAYDIVLANSQLSQLLGLDDVVGDLPANLTLMKFLTASFAGTSNQIRYAALIAGLQKLELEYQAGINIITDTPFMTKVASEFADDQGQMFYHTEAIIRELTLVELYQAAHDNLKLIAPTVTNNEIKVLAEGVVADLSAQLDAAKAQPADVKTAAQPDDLSLLLTETELDYIDLGLEKTKLFVNSIIDLENTFWEEGYKEELDAYRALLKTLGDAQKDNLNALVAEFARIQDYYVTCIIGGLLCDADFSDLEARKTSYDTSTKVLVLDSGAITVSQALANLSIVGETDISESNAVNIFIVGTLKKDNLVLKVGHTFTDTEETDINVPSAMRIYYPEQVTEVQPELIIEGYEIIWGDFQLYDESAIGLDTETDLSGAFRIFFRGVRDPQNTDVPNSSELRYNIESLGFSSVITDSVVEGEIDGDVLGIDITATSSNPGSFYPNSKFSNFQGFFESNNSHVIGDVEPDLLRYRLGTEVVKFDSGETPVETIDFINRLGGDVRYRFFPDMLVEDKGDSNSNGDVDELVVMHLIEECELSKGTQDVIKCGPKSRIFAERNLQETISGLWSLGAFQRTDVDAQGSYFIDFPTVEDEAGCLVLDTLVADSGPMSGTLLEPQVLGLDSVRVRAQLALKDADLVELPNTLLDVAVTAPTENKYKVNMSLSHNYTEITSSDESSSDSLVVLDTVGGDRSVLKVSYDTSADFEDSGSFAVFQGGVQLTLEDGSEIEEDQDIAAFFSQTFSEDVHYTLTENEEGDTDRCVLSVGTNYVKDPDLDPGVNQVFYLNYRDIVYGTARKEGDAWVIRYIDGTWKIPSSGEEG
jgi:hypothetical protein